MKKMWVWAAMACALAACSEKPGYTITGSVNNPSLDGQYVYLYPYGERDAAPLDSALVSGGTFTFKGSQDSAALRTVQFAASVVAPSYASAGENAPFSVTFALSNAPIQVTLDTLSDATGTPQNEALQAFKAEIRSMRAAQKKLMADLKSEDEAVRRAAEQQYDETDRAIARKADAFIRANMDNPLSGKLFYDFRYDIPEAAQNEIAAASTPTFRAVPGIEAILTRLENLKTVAVGKQFTDFELKDMKGNPVKLSDYVGKGKVVLIDFWASWCPPCRREMPNLVALYKEYKSKGFEIVGVSLDSKQEAWEKGVKDLKITWPQMSDLAGWQNAGAAKYFVNSIPHTILVDGNGVILAKNLHGDELKTKVAEALK